MMCPKCQRDSLKQKYVSALDLTLDYCTRCKGIWFDGGELYRAMPQAEKLLRIPPNAVRLEAECPRCPTLLHTFPYPGTKVVVEMCGKCDGLWLDANEFAALRKARQELRDNPPVEEPAEPDGVKGALIQFIDAAIEFLWY
jgi:Zn-finger nucleic acid-binding protein